MIQLSSIASCLKSRTSHSVSIGLRRPGTVRHLLQTSPSPPAYISSPLRTLSTYKMAPTKVAILDDYQGVADPYFAKLDSSKYEVVSLKDTALPYNHPDNTQSGRDAL